MTKLKFRVLMSSKLKHIGVPTLAFFLLLLDPGCRQKSHFPPHPDITGITVELSIKRFEKDLMEADTSGLYSMWNRLVSDYREFLPCFYENIMQLGSWTKDSVNRVAKMHDLLAYGGFRAAADSALAHYPQLEDLQASLEQLLRYYRYYFPQDTLPRFVTFVSEYGYGVVDCGNTFGIGLDLFLGENFPYYPALGIPQYITRRMEPDYILPTVAITLADRKVPPPEDNTLLAQMIRNGKKLLLVDFILPDEPDFRKIGYTEDQLAWCRKNEGEVWAYLQGEDLLYKTDRLRYIKFVKDSPNTPGLPPDAPGNIGSWIGWQIVRKYMAATGNDLKSLLQKDSYQEILEKSRYKPRRN